MSATKVSAILSRGRWGNGSLSLMKELPITSQCWENIENADIFYFMSLYDYFDGSV